MACRRRHKPNATWNSSRPWCVRYVWEQPLFDQAGGGAVGFEMGGVDHDGACCGALNRQRREDTVEHADHAAADEPVLERLVRPVSLRRITPHQAAPDYMNDTADDAPIIHARHSS
jgi:hypothetical protein|tara:strand:+ start:24510 stop:24857 length:348 start_codon:yes stop_codon:yes gene_type:complete